MNQNRAERGQWKNRQNIEEQQKCQKQEEISISGNGDKQICKPNLKIQQKSEQKSQQIISLQETSNLRRHRIRSQIWTLQEIRKIFKLYNEYGSHWKFISSEFEDRTPNSVKNRFYTTIRILLKSLFRQHPQLGPKLPHEIPSKKILTFFEGQKEFNRFKDIGKKLLKIVDYDPESPRVTEVVQQYSLTIVKIYKLMFTDNSKKALNLKKKEPKAVKSEKQISPMVKSEHGLKQELEQKQHNPALKTFATQTFFQPFPPVPPLTVNQMGDGLCFQQQGFPLYPWPVQFFPQF